MADYVSQFTGPEIDAQILKSKQINKSAQQVNDSLQAVDNLQAGITGARVGEVFSKSNTGSLEGTGIINGDDKIFFPKDGRFPSGSIDVGPAITLSENGGFLQQKAHTLDKDYLVLTYENQKTGTSRPIYWERAAEEKNVVIQPDNTGTLTQAVFFHTPIVNSQVNALYMDFANSVNNVCIEVVSVNTGKPIKYIPNEQAWKNNVGGLDIGTGVQNVLGDTPISALTTYNLRFNFSKTVTVRGGGGNPYMAVDRQLITQKGLLLQGEGTGSPDTAEQIKNKLSTLSGENRLDASAIKNIPSSGGSGAATDLSNVDNSVFKSKGVSAGLLQQDLEDVDLFKLKEKVDAAKANLITVGELHGDYHQGDVKEIQLHNGFDVTIDTQNKVASISLFENAFANLKLDNVSTSDLDKAIRLTNAYKEIVNKKPEHDGVVARHIEEQGVIDFSTITEKLIHAVYQITAEQEVISQTLPPITDDKTIIIEVIMSSGISGFDHLTLSPSGSDKINGDSTPLTLTEKGILGVLIPEASNSWIWIPYPMMHDLGIGINDQRSNFFLGMKDISFGAGFTATQDPSVKTTVKIDYAGSGTNELTFKDGFTGNDFQANKIQSTDKSIRISNLNGVADFSKGFSDHNEGIHACLGIDQLINSKFPKTKLYFGDMRVKGGQFVYPDMDTKSFIIQDTDPTDDPNVSGGTTFFIGIYYEPNPLIDNTITQDGSIEIQLVDDADNVLIDTNDNPINVMIKYKAGDKAKPELYLGEIQATASTRVHMKIKPNFPNEEIISAGSNTQICLQSLSKDESGGLALLSFMAYTGFRISFDSKYYGYNSLNLAQYLIFDEPETVVSPSTAQLGDNVYANFATSGKAEIAGRKFILQDDGVNLPVFSITKLYTPLDCKYIGGKNANVKVVLENKDNAFRVALLRYTGSSQVPPIPNVERYLNSNPVFTNGWIKQDDLFISENPLSDGYTVTKTFQLPEDQTGIAIILYPEVSESPCLLKLSDFEADISPAFTKMIITSTDHISELHMYSKEYYKFGVYTPSGYSAYRFTANLADTKVPIGAIVQGSGGKLKSEPWPIIEGVDPNKVQADLKILADGTLTMKYTIRAFNDTQTNNDLFVWLAKVNTDNTFTEVQYSKILTRISHNTKIPQLIDSTTFDFDVKNGETYRMFMKSNINDGFYLQSDTNGVPLFEATIKFNGQSAIDQDLINRVTYLESSANEVKFVDNGKEVYNKMLEYDVSTGRMKVVDKI